MRNTLIQRIKKKLILNYMLHYTTLFGHMPIDHTSQVTSA